MNRKRRGADRGRFVEWLQRAIGDCETVMETSEEAIESAGKRADLIALVDATERRERAARAADLLRAKLIGLT